MLKPRPKSLKITQLLSRHRKTMQVMRAPFDGIITARYADPGALVQAATSAQTTALPVVALSQTDRLRVYVYPDQKTASSVQMGDKAEVSDVTRPETKLSATVSRTTGELDVKTRTLLVEIELGQSRREDSGWKFCAGDTVHPHPRYH